MEKSPRVKVVLALAFSWLDSVRREASSEGEKREGSSLEGEELVVVVVGEWGGEEEEGFGGDEGCVSDGKVGIAAVCRGSFKLGLQRRMMDPEMQDRDIRFCRVS